MLALSTKVGCLFLLFAQCAHAEPQEPDYAAITESIRSRIIAIQEKHPLLKNMATARPPAHFPLRNDLYFEYAVKWMLDVPSQRPSKTNARRPVYETDDAFWFRVTFYRGPYGGAAVHQPIRFGDLRVWLSYGYNKDSSVIVSVTKVIREEKKKFDAKYPGLSEKPDERADRNKSIDSEKSVSKDSWFKQNLSSDERETLVEISKKEPFSELASILLNVITHNQSFFPGIGDKPWNADRMTSRDRTYWMAVTVWKHHMSPIDDPSKTKVLLALLRETRNQTEKNILISAIEHNQWNDEGERVLADIAESKKEPLDSRCRAVGALLYRCDLNRYMPLAIEIILAHDEGMPRLQAFSSTTNLGNRLFALNAKNRHAVISTGFEILTELSDKELRTGYFVAIQLGFILKVNNEFKPNQKAEKYQGPNGLNDEFFVDTVKNAIEWSAQNWKEQEGTE